MQSTVINISCSTEGKFLSLTLPWDANLEDWKDAFKTILTHQTFAPQTIAEIFNEEDLSEAEDFSDEDLELDVFSEKSLRELRELLNKECDLCDKPARPTLPENTFKSDYEY